MELTTSASPKIKHSAITPDLQHEIEQFLYFEANLLDSHQYKEWYELLAQDVRYWMPIRLNLTRADRAARGGDHSKLALFDDTKETMWIRIKRLLSGKAWAEEPPSRVRHLVTNVRIRPHHDDTEYEVRSCFLVHRSRLERQSDEYVGERVDILRRTNKPQGWEIVRREIYLDQATILSNNISVLF